MDKKRLQKLAGILKEEIGEGDFSPTAPGYYWFKEFVRRGSKWKSRWEIVLFENGMVERIASDMFHYLFQGSEEEYFALGQIERENKNLIGGLFVGPLQPPSE